MGVLLAGVHGAPVSPKSCGPADNTQVQVAFVGLGHPGRCRAMGNEKDPDFRLAGATGALHAPALECCALKRGHFPQPEDREESGCRGPRPQLPCLVSRCVERRGAGHTALPGRCPETPPSTIRARFLLGIGKFSQISPNIVRVCFLKVQTYTVHSSFKIPFS